MPVIRPETDADHAAVARCVQEAFGGEDEVRLIEGLRAAGDVLVEQVAVDGEAVVGHVLFSTLGVEVDGTPVRAAALAPLAVRLDRQRLGIGALLVEAGLAACRDIGIEAVIVVGDPGYYGRFGFASEMARNLQAPFSGEAFMALELKPGVLNGRAGTVRYAAAFDLDN